MSRRNLNVAASLLCCLLAVAICWIWLDRPPAPVGVVFSDAQVQSFFRKSQRGDGEASFCLYLNYAEREDRKARYWLKKAAKQGNADGQYYLWNTNRDVEWLKKAASQGQPSAEARLGDYYIRKGDRNQAELWYKKSAYQGNLYAIERLSALLENDRNDKECLLQSYAWSTVALNLHSPGSMWASKYYGGLYKVILEKVDRKGWDQRFFLDKAAVEAQSILTSIRKIWVATDGKCLEKGD